jgi:hypothetical protein
MDGAVFIVLSTFMLGAIKERNEQWFMNSHRARISEMGVRSHHKIKILNKI